VCAIVLMLAMVIIMHYMHCVTSEKRLCVSQSERTTIYNLYEIDSGQYANYITKTCRIYTTKGTKIVATTKGNDA
jgi:hypothetical protein